MTRKFTLLCFLFAFAFAFVHGQKGSAIKKRQKTGIAAIPMINYNRTQGIVAGALVTGFYKINKKDTISPSSSTGFIGIYTEQKSYAFMTYSQLFFAEDKWRILAAAGTVDINFQFYVDNPTSSTGNFYDYSTKANLVMLQAQRNVFRRIYFGPIASLMKSTTKFGFPGASGEDSVHNANLNYVGYIISNDTRDHVQYPTRGMFLNFKNQFYRSWVGSGYNFERYLVTYNQFFRLTNETEKKILAVRASFNIASGNVPFEGQTVVGGDDIRGYSQGKYRNNQVYTLQAEYRWNFYKRWGMVAFAGVASAVAKLSDMPKNDLLPGVGAGVRFRMLPSEKINIGVDYGVGKDDYSITFRIGEAFGR